MPVATDWTLILESGQFYKKKSLHLQTTKIVKFPFLVRLWFLAPSYTMLGTFCFMGNLVTIDHFNAYRLYGLQNNTQTTATWQSYHFPTVSFLQYQPVLFYFREGQERFPGEPADGQYGSQGHHRIQGENHARNQNIGVLFNHAENQGGKILRLKHFSARYHEAPHFKLHLCVTSEHLLHVRTVL